MRVNLDSKCKVSVQKRHDETIDVSANAYGRASLWFTATHHINCLFHLKLHLKHGIGLRHFKSNTNLTTHHFVLCVCTDQTMQAAAEIARIVQCQ